MPSTLILRTHMHIHSTSTPTGSHQEGGGVSFFLASPAGGLRAFFVFVPPLSLSLSRDLVKSSRDAAADDEKVPYLSFL